MTTPMEEFPCAAGDGFQAVQLPYDGDEIAMLVLVPESGRFAEVEAEYAVLEPGGYHIMLLDISTPLELGETFDVTLTFENAGEQVVEVEVREEAP